MAAQSYIQKKADLWKRIKEIEGVPTIDWASSKIDELETHLTVLEEGEKKVAYKGDVCQANCTTEAKKYVRLVPKWGWQLRPFGKPNIPHYVQGPLITFCPFCGRRLHG